MNFAKIGIGGAAALVLVGLGACDNGPSAVRSRDRDATTASYDSPSSSRNDSFGSSGRGRSGADEGYRASRTPGDGDSFWAGSKKYPAAESADYHFKQDGGDFGAHDVKEYVAKAHAFIGHPPQGTETLKRSNGDVLYYNPQNNVFAVATRDGVPRTMFKPRDGAAYWAQQKEREANGGGRSYRSRGGNGGGDNASNGRGDSGDQG